MCYINLVQDMITIMIMVMVMAMDIHTDILTDILMVRLKSSQKKIMINPNLLLSHKKLLLRKDKGILMLMQHIFMP